MPLWLNVPYLLFGLVLVAKGLADRSWKNPMLYFGASVLLSSIADFLPASASALNIGLQGLAALSVIVAAVFMFAFAEPVKTKPNTNDS